MWPFVLGSIYLPRMRISSVPTYHTCTTFWSSFLKGSFCSFFSVFSSWYFLAKMLGWINQSFTYLVFFPLLFIIIIIFSSFLGDFLCRLPWLNITQGTLHSVSLGFPLGLIRFPRKEFFKLLSCRIKGLDAKVLETQWGRRAGSYIFSMCTFTEFTHTHTHTHTSLPGWLLLFFKNTSGITSSGTFSMISLVDIPTKPSQRTQGLPLA